MKYVDHDSRQFMFSTCHLRFVFVLNVICSILVCLCVYCVCDDIHYKYVYNVYHDVT